MKAYKAKINDFVVATNVKLADTFLSRLIGLLGHKNLENGEGLLISRCKQVHTFGMKFNIDVFFLSKDGEIIYIENDMRPGRISRNVKSAVQVFEIKSGTAKENDIEPHSKIMFELIA